MIDTLLGFRAPSARSAYLIPFADPRGGWFDYVKLKVFNGERATDLRSDHVAPAPRSHWQYNPGARKYLVRWAAQLRLYFPLATMAAALESAKPLWIIEGMKKALAVAQLGLPAVGIESVWSWHERNSRALLPDFDFIVLQGRIAELMISA